MPTTETYTKQDVRRAVDFMDAAVQAAPKRGALVKFTCPICGGEAIAGRVERNGHLFASCECGARVQE